MTTTTLSTAERRANALKQLRDGRALIAGLLEDVRVDELTRGAQWGVADVLQHLMGRPVFFNLVDRMLAEDRPQLPPRPGPEAMFQRLKDGLLSSIDETIAFAEGLSVEQLERSAARGDQTVRVIDFIEAAAGHYLEHGNQIKNEILPRIRGS